jgi:ribokinase
VIGHVEWVEFVRVEHVPAPGEIVHGLDRWELPGGGGAVAAVQLAKLAGACVLFTALGDDELGHRAARELGELGVRVEAVFRPVGQRRAFTYIDALGERTITTIGDRLGPRGGDPLAWDELDGTATVYFCAGDREALRAGRRARALVATTRVLPDLARAGLPLDAVVGSGGDPSERYVPGVLDPPPRLAVATEGDRGGSYAYDDGSTGRYEAASVPGRVVDAYGCGDSFAAGLAFALGAGSGIDDALTLAARCGAACLSGRGPYEGQLRLAG